MHASASALRTLIKGGRVVNDDYTQEADVYIENGVIQLVGRELMIPGGAKVIDATGKLVMPGGIDTSTHFQETFMNMTSVDDYYLGTKVMRLPGIVSTHATPHAPPTYLSRIAGHAANTSTSHPHTSHTLHSHTYCLHPIPIRVCSLCLCHSSLSLTHYTSHMTCDGWKASI